MGNSTVTNGNFESFGPIAVTIALFTVNFSRLCYIVFERGRKAISAILQFTARKCLTSKFKYIVMQMRKVNREKGYCKRKQNLVPRSSTANDQVSFE